MKRRDFFRLAGTGVAGVALGAALPACSKPSIAPQVDSGSENVAVSVGVPVDFSQETDVLIVGSGIAGLSAAMDPSEAGYSVIVADKLDVMGGESYSSTGLVYVSGTEIQKQAGITTDIDEAWKKHKELLGKAGFSGSLDLEKKLFEAGTEWVNRVVENYGALFANPKSYTEKGSTDLFLIPKTGLGDMANIMSSLKDKLTTQGVSYLLGMTAVGFILNDQAVPVGMRFFTKETNTITDVRAKKIIIASGGYICNQELVYEYLPTQAALANYTTYSTGEGHQLCQAINGQLKDMDKPAPLTSDLPQVDAWGQFGPIIAVSPAAKRIAAEDQIGAAALACANEELGFWWTIFTNKLSENGRSRSVSNVNGKHPKRMVGPFDTVEDLAKAMEVPQDALKETFDSYHELVDKEKDTAFDKTLFLSKLDAPYYAVRQFPNRFRSFGGISTDEDARMIDAVGNTIPQVFCCGSCAASSLLGLSSAAAFGMIAGGTATDELKEGAGDDDAPEESTPQ